MPNRVSGTYTRTVDGKTFEWEQQGLIDSAQYLPIAQVSIESVGVLDSTMWCRSGDPRLTVRQIAEAAKHFLARGRTEPVNLGAGNALVIEHAQRIMDADLTYPIILGADGKLMDGAHRVAKALITGQSTVGARRFKMEPAPDRIR